MSVISNLVQDKIDKTIVNEMRQDCEPILEHNKLLRSLPQKSDWGAHVASIPCVIEMKWLNDEWKRGNTKLRWGSREWMAIVEAKLQDPDWKFLKVGYK